MKKLYKRLSLFTLSLLMAFNIALGTDCHAAAADTSLSSRIDTVSIGGMPFGVKFFSEGIVIVGFTEINTPGGKKTPAYDAGLRVNDIITHVNGVEVKSSSDLIKNIEKADKKIVITYLRNGSENTVSFTPSVSDSDGKLKTGMWVRDTTAGIGTITFIIPKTGEFAGLGHGICDQQSGELLKMEKGTVVNVQISGVTRGISGTPGELKGFFTSDKSGILINNTLCGVSGVLAEVPNKKIPQNNVKLGRREAVHNGSAYIWCTVDEDLPRKYEVEISDVNQSSRDNRSFSITVTDTALLNKTGGIIQGMSGSPIIQDDCLIGAVTHVLINDPARGYGIFIDNMIESTGIGNNTIE